MSCIKYYSLLSDDADGSASLENIYAPSPMVQGTSENGHQSERLNSLSFISYNF